MLPAVMGNSCTPTSTLHFLGRHGGVAGAEIDRLVLDVLHAGAAADRLVVDLHVGMGRAVGLEPLAVQRRRESSRRRLAT